jgi:hypothetical protein
LADKLLLAIISRSARVRGSRAKAVLCATLTWTAGRRLSGHTGAQWRRQTAGLLRLFGRKYSKIEPKLNDGASDIRLPLIAIVRIAPYVAQVARTEKRLSASHRGYAYPTFSRRRRAVLGPWPDTVPTVSRLSKFKFGFGNHWFMAVAQRANAILVAAMRCRHQPHDVELARRRACRMVRPNESTD